MLEYRNLKLASDIEAKGFYDVVNSKEDIHCLCSVDIDTGKVILFHNNPEFDNVVVVDPYDNKEYTIPKRSGTLDEGIAFWGNAANNGSVLIIHNCHTYDRPVIDKIWPENTIPFDSYHDTFIQSKLQWFERPCPKGAKSPHGLKAWGIKCGINKPEITDWSTMDAFKLHRVIEDCKIQAQTYLMLEKERSYLKDTYSIDFTYALKVEALYAHECFLQETTGVMVDIDHIKRCIDDLDIKIEVLRAEIEPQLPPTIKGATTKVSRKEMAELFGFDSSKIVESTSQRKKDGEVVTVVDKPYYKPTINFTSKEKVNQYYGFNLSYGATPIFNKKKDLTDWIKVSYPETKNKDWDIEKKEVITEVLNAHTCNWFGVEPTDTHIISGPFTRIEIEPSTMTQSDIVKAFLIKLGWKDADSWNIRKDAYDNWIKAEQDVEVRWPEKALPEHQLVKFVKKGEYLVSSPKLTDDDYDQLPEGLGKKIAEYNTYQHRRRFLENPEDPENKGLLSYVRDDGRIPAGVNNFATRSGRGAQRIWVNAPSDSALYGKEIRQSVICPEGKVLVGIDMKSAQLSIAAYYANNYEYYNNVASGMEYSEDGKYVGQTAHCVNARMFGMVSEIDWQSAVETQDKELIHKITLKRKASKGGSFAVIFGASGKKVAKTIGIPEKEGAKRKDQFLKQMGLDNTIKALSLYEDKFKYKGGFYLPLAFGYWLWNNSSHKSVNTIVQGFEALAQKMAAIRLGKELDRLGLRNHIKRVLDVHDETLLEVSIGYEEQAGKLGGSCYTWAAEQIFKYHRKTPEHFANHTPPQFAIDLNGGYKVGKNYYDVH
jgi:DNA polymerase family A